MKKLAILILCLIGASAQAGSVRIKGVITSTLDTTLPVQVGDPFSARIIYNNQTHAVTRTIIHIGLLRFVYPNEGASFNFNDDPCESLVAYQVSSTGSAHMTFQLFGWTSNSCVFPPLPQFVINEWTFFLNGQTAGVLTVIPEVYP
jgi:hypothetical protein